MRYACRLFQTTLAGLVASAGVAAGSAHAQAAAPAPTPATPPAAAPSGGIQDIVITARRTAENIQRTPIAVTALTGDALQRKQITNIAGLQGSVPTLSILAGSPAGSGYAIPSIRGQAEYNNNLAADPAVGLYQDGVYAPRAAGSLLNLIDVQRIEVLRGPQGTLFGRDTVGGAINIYTKQPNGNWEGELQGELGNYNEEQVTGIVNIPIIGDQLDLRLDYQHESHGGYGENVTLNRPTGDLDQNIGRAQLKIAPDGAKWDLTFSGDWSVTRDSGEMTALVALNPSVVTPGALAPNGYTETTIQHFVQNSGNFYNTYGGTIPFSDGTPRLPFDYDTTTGYSARFNYDLGWAKFKSITAYRSLINDAAIDLDGTPVAILQSYTNNKDHNLSQEFQLSGTEGKLSWITGLYGFWESGTNYGWSQSKGYLDLTDAAARLAFTHANTYNNSYAGYAQIYYQFTDKLRGYAGIRYTADQRIADIGNTAAHGVLHAISSPPDPSVDDLQICLTPNLAGVCDTHKDAWFHYPSYSAGLDYQLTPSVFLYTSFNTAYISGAWNVRATTVPAVAPEGDKTLEFGVKSDWFDHRLRIDADVFHTWQTNVQRQVNGLVGGLSTAFSINAGNAEITGAEFEVTALPWTGMEIDAGLGLLSGSYDKGTFINGQTVALGSGPPNPNPAQCTVLAAPNPPGTYFCNFDESGEPLPQFPNVTFNIGGTQTIPVSVGLITLHMDYSYISQQHYVGDTAAPEQPPSVAAQYVAAEQANILPAHGVLNAQVSLDIGDTGIQIALWGKNITGSKYYADNFDSYVGVGFVEAYLAPPATFGGTFTYKFGR